MVKGVSSDTQTYTLRSTFFDLGFNEIKINMTLNSSGLTAKLIKTFKMNKPPSGGNCSVDKTTGYFMSTYFYITCSNWVDIDSSIDNYRFFGKKRY